MANSDFDNVHMAVITSDLFTLPLVIIDARNLEDLREQLGMWSQDAEITEAEWQVVANALRQAKCPNDGLLGMQATEPFSLPSLHGMTMHIQITD